MRFKLPLIGEVNIGKDPVETVVKEINKKVEKSVLGGFVDFRSSGLSNEESTSSRVLQANNGWVYRNTDVIAKEVSGIEFELFAVRIVGGEVVYNPILTHPLLDALDRFNEFTDSSTGFYITEAHRTLAGDSFWYIEGNGPNIKGIYILQPDKVKLKFGKVKGSTRIIDAYEFRDTIKGQQIVETYKPEEIIHHKVPNPKNPYRGLGKVEAAADTIDTDTMAIEANKALYKRGLISNFILTTPNKLTSEQLNQLHAEFKATYQGVENAFNVPIFGSDLKPQSVQQSNKDMQFIDQQKWLRDKIMSIFGNTPSVLGIVEDVNRANSEAGILNWKRTTIRAEMKQITDTLNEFYVPRFGDNLVLGFKDPVEEDRTSKIDDVKKLIEANVITPNEAREELSYDKLPDADRLREASTQQIPEIPKSLQYVNIKQILRRNGIYKQVKQFEEYKKIARPVAEKMVKGRKKPVVKKQYGTFTEEQVEVYYQKQMRIVEANEKIFEQKVERFINRLVDKALANVPEEVADMQQKQLINEADEIVQATLDFTPILMEVATAAGQHALSLIDSDKPYIPTDIRKVIAKRVEMFAESMIKTDRDKLIDIIAEGVRNGDSIPRIRNEIVDTFSEYSKMQAQRITRTEVLRTSNISAVDAWEQSGVVEGKQWLIAPTACPECEPYDGDIVSLSGNFYAPSEFAQGDPPIHPNCRCTVLPVIIGEKGVETERFKLKGKIAELESKIETMDKRTKEYKATAEELKSYVEELEEYING